ITALTFQPGEAILATGHDDGKVRVWDWAEQKLLCEADAHRMPVSAVAFSWDGSRLATAGEDRRLHPLALRTGPGQDVTLSPARTLEGHKDRISGLAWHPDSRRLYSAAWDTTVRVWDVQAKEPIILLNYHATQVLALALSGDGKLLASADSDNAVHIRDTDQQRNVAILREPTGEVRALAFSPDDDHGNIGPAVLAFGGADPAI